MKSIISIIAASLFSISAIAAEPYISVGAAGSDNAGNLNIGGGLQVGRFVAVEGEYLKERSNRQMVTDHGAAGVEITTSTKESHGGGAALVGLLPLGKLGAQTTDLIGRIERSRLKSGDEIEWRTTIGAGVQFGDPKSLRLRVMLDHGNDGPSRTQMSVKFLQSF